MNSATKAHTGATEAGVRELRDHLSRYLEVVRAGAEVTVTNHGTAIARLVPITAGRPLDRLVADRLATRAPTAKRPRGGRRIAAHGSVSNLIAEQRR
jgi:prevent-host-death family protein